MAWSDNEIASGIAVVGPAFFVMLTQLSRKGRNLPTIRWQASRDGVCWVGARFCFDEEMKAH